MKKNSVQKRQISCNLCGSDDHVELYPDELSDRPARVDYDFSRETRLTYRIVRCRGCGLVFVNPMPDLSTAYEDTVDQVYLATLDQRRRTAEWAVRRLRRHVGGGRLLDIGCATGTFLDAAAPWFATEGIELSRWAREIAAERHAVHAEPLSCLGLADRFDAVTLWGVIEHFTDPADELRAIHRALKPGGGLAIYAGDVEAWLPRLLGKRWWYYMGMHLHYFSRRTLTRMLERMGFQVAKTETFAVYFRLNSLGTSFRRYRLAAPVSWALDEVPVLRDAMIRLKLNGEMLVIARKES